MAALTPGAPGTPEPRWLHALFSGSVAVIVLCLGYAIALDLGRPVTVEQRIVPALGVIDRCESCHDTSDHPGTLVDSHPPERFGCTPCHGGQGLAVTKQAAHERALDWEQPLFTELEREAACGGCHEGSPVPGAPLLSRGRDALNERGCAGCHELPGFAPSHPAPDLDGLKDKATAGWVRAWLARPAELNSLHRMPVFRLSSEEREALVAYLFERPGPELAEGPEGDADRGRTAVAYRRCATCHRIEGRGGTFSGDLASAGAKLNPRWLFTYLTDTHARQPRTLMPGFRLPPQEAADIAAYAAEQWVPDTETLPWTAEEGPVRPEVAGVGRALFASLGCSGCHRVKGAVEERNSVALARLGAHGVGELLQPRSGATVPDVPSWIATKILDPTAFDTPGGVPSRMPAFHRVEGDDARAIGVAIAALGRRAAPAGYAGPPGVRRAAVPGGETGRLFERFRCLVCHRLDGEGGDLSRVPLDGEGSRVRREWLARFIEEPVTLRMDQPERMPVLGLTKDEAAHLAAWITTGLADDRIPRGEPLDPAEAPAGQALYAGSGCAECHMAAGAGTMKGPVLDGACDRLTTEYLVALLSLGPEVVPGGRHPAGTRPLAEARALAAYVCSLAVPGQ